MVCNAHLKPVIMIRKESLDKAQPTISLVCYFIRGFNSENDCPKNCSFFFPPKAKIHPSLKRAE